MKIVCSQNNISMLPVAEQTLCIDGMIDAAERACQRILIVFQGEQSLTSALIRLVLWSR